MSDNMKDTLDQDVYVDTIVACAQKRGRKGKPETDEDRRNEGDAQ